jgi:hypothetical protein
MPIGVHKTTVGKSRRSVVIELRHGGATRAGREMWQGGLSEALVINEARHRKSWQLLSLVLEHRG